MKKKDITIDDRDFENQSIQIPAKFPDQDKIDELILRSYYDKNKKACIDFINSHTIIKQIETAEIYYFDEMDLSRFENIRKLSLDSDTFHPSGIPKIDRLNKLESLTLCYTPTGDEKNLISFIKGLDKLPALKYFEWTNCPINSLDSFAELSNISDLTISLANNNGTLDALEINAGDKQQFKIEKLNKNLRSLKVSASDDVTLILAKDLSLYSNLISIDFSQSNLANIENYILLKENIGKVQIKFGNSFENLEKQMNYPYNQQVEFDLYGLNLTEVPNFISNYSLIKSFKINSLRKNITGIFDADTFNRIKSESIEIFEADCALKIFPEIIKNMSNLRKLNLGGYCGSTNFISIVPDWIGQLEKLEFLDLVDNSIQSFPSSIVNCKNLKQIYLHNDDGDYVHSNPICRNSQEIEKLKQLLPDCNIIFN